MTEAEWLACNDPDPMLDFLRAEGKLSPRKARLLAVAACRRIWRLYTEEKNRAEIEVAEADAEAMVTYDNAERDWVRRCRRCAAASSLEPESREPFTADEEAIWNAAFEAESAAQATLLRDLFGPLLFHSPPPLAPAVLGWNGGCVVKLATTIYEQKRFEDLSVLADALEEAGCTDAELPGHLRGLGPHVRGCFAVDLLLGKS
jgi:hypothetical protein